MSHSDAARSVALRLAGEGQVLTLGGTTVRLIRYDKPVTDHRQTAFRFLTERSFGAGKARAGLMERHEGLPSCGRYFHPLPSTELNQGFRYASSVG